MLKSQAMPDTKHPDTKYWVALNRIPHLGTVRFRQLEQHFGLLKDAWTAGEGALQAAGLDSRAISEVIAHRNSISPDGEMETLARASVRAVTWHDDEYPARLREIYDPPPVIYVKGAILPEDWRSIAIVGTRNATDYGRQAATTLARDLAKAGVTVVSGLARGIDGIAHREVISIGKRTIAVLANGLDRVYPPEHASLSDAIAKQGALISEHPLGTKPRAQQFPRRNRIMSGMTLGTLVIEAGEVSGALATANHANDQGREVFCVPGSIFSHASRGVNLKIQRGEAKLVLTLEDILQELNLTSISQQMELPALAETQGNDAVTPLPQPVEAPAFSEPLEGEEGSILAHITTDPLHIDEIRCLSQLPIALVSSTLAMMELKGLVRQVGGMHYVRA